MTRVLRFWRMRQAIIATLTWISVHAETADPSEVAQAATDMLVTLGEK